MTFENPFGEIATAQAYSSKRKANKKSNKPISRNRMFSEDPFGDLAAMQNSPIKKRKMPINKTKIPTGMVLSEDPFGEIAMNQDYKNPGRKKSLRVLITAGPTREQIDAVRYISNMSTGNLGVEIAKEAHRRGYNTHLLYGFGTAQVPDYIPTERFTTTESLLEKVSSRIKNYDIFISAAAVSDYATVPKNEKISSDNKELTIKLKQTPKVIKEARKIANKNIRFVAFKLGYNLNENKLIKQAIDSYGSVADIMVCNDLANITENEHPATILYKNKRVSKVNNKKQIARAIFENLEKYK